MTHLYFVRHAQPEYSVHDDNTRPLTAKGKKDCGLVTRLLTQVGVDTVVSSPYLRAMDTVLPYARSRGLGVIAMEAFRERKAADEWLEDFDGFARRQWADFSYKLPDGECLAQVQKRAVEGVGQLLKAYAGHVVAIGTHGTALSTILHYYDRTFTYADFEAIRPLMPWVAHLAFDQAGALCQTEFIDVFA